MGIGNHRYAEIVENDPGAFDRKLTGLLDQIRDQGGHVVKLDMLVHPALVSISSGQLSVARTAQVIYVDTPGMKIDVQ